MGQVHPVGGVGEVANALVLRAKKLAEESEKAVDHEPAVKGRAETEGESVVGEVDGLVEVESVAVVEDGDGEEEMERPPATGLLLKHGAAETESAKTKEEAVVEELGRPGERAHGGIGSEGLGHEVLRESGERDENYPADRGAEEPAGEGFATETGADPGCEGEEGDEPQDVVEKPEVHEERNHGSNLVDLDQETSLSGGATFAQRCDDVLASAHDLFPIDLDLQPAGDCFNHGPMVARAVEG